MQGESKPEAARGAELAASEARVRALEAQLARLGEQRAAYEERDGRLRAMLENLPELVWTARADGHIDYYNQRWYEYTGTTVDQMEGWGWQSVHHPAELPRVMQRWQRSIDTGEPFEMEFPLRGADGVYRWFLTRARPLRGDDAKIQRWFGTNTDIDAQKRAREALAVLSEADAALAASTDAEQAIAQVARLAVPRLADWCYIEMLEPDGSFRRLALSHADPAKESFGWELSRRYPVNPADAHGVPNVVRTGEAEMVADITDEMLVASVPDKELLGIVRELGLRSAITVPILLRGRGVGAIALIASESRRRYTDVDLAFGLELGRRASGALLGATLLAERGEAEASVREEREALAVLGVVNQLLSGELDLEKLAQSVTDAGVRLSGAECGAFFHGVQPGEGGEGERYARSALSPLPTEGRAPFAAPRSADLFGAGFEGEGVVRIGDITAAPARGQPPRPSGALWGERPVRSYLAVPVRSREGEVIGALCFGHRGAGVFTERSGRLVAGLSAQAAIAMDNARLYADARAAASERAAILGQIADGVIVTNPAGEVRFVNAAARALHGVSATGTLVPDYASAFGLLTMKGEPYPPAELPLARAVLRHETVLGAMWKIRRPDGSEIVALGNALPVRGDGGKTLGAVLTLRDVTSQLSLERSLRASEERYRSLIDAGAQTVWTTDAGGQMRGEQPGWSRYSGQSAAEYEGVGWASAVHPDDRAETLARWGEAIGRTAVFLAEPRVRRADGVYRDVSVRAVPVLEPEGGVREWVGVNTDVTDRRRFEAERERLIRALEGSNLELDQFAYVASHDLKAPLRGIANLSQWVEEDMGAAMPDDARDKMRLLRGRVHRLEALIDGILSYSRAGRVREKAETVDVAQLIGEAVELLAPPAGVVRLEGAMPVLWAERVPLQQVFMNLIGNALKYTRRPDPRVEVSARSDGEQIIFAVRDNGPGIAPAFHDRIWAIFQTLEARDRVEGTGIGLSVVKKIVETRGGRVWVESSEGAGATFFFGWRQRAEGAR